MAGIGITGFGGYIPLRRLARTAIADANAWANPVLKAAAKGEKAIANWDEDSLTMAVAAAREAGVGRSVSVSSVWFASTTAPFADRSNAGVLAAALNLPDETATIDSSGSLRAGTSALVQAVSTLSGPDSPTVLLAAADKRKTRPASTQEMRYGDAAAALVLGSDSVVATILGCHSVAVDLVDHYRASDSDFDYSLEERWVREEGYFKIIPDAVEALLGRTGVAPGQIDRCIIPGPARTVSKLAAKLGISAEAVCDGLHDRCGDTGVAHPLLMLIGALEVAEPAEKILVCGFGQGADAILLEATPAIRDVPAGGLSPALEGGRADSNYIRYLSNSGLISLEWGLRAERDNRTALSTLYRQRKAVHGFVGGRCSACGTIQFPRSQVCVNPECRKSHTQEEFGFADLTGTVKSFTEDWLAYTPSPPLQYGNIEFEGGGNLMMEFTDCDPGEIEVGMAVKMQFRIKDVDERRAFRRYFWKPTPVRT